MENIYMVISQDGSKGAFIGIDAAMSAGLKSMEMGHGRYTVRRATSDETAKYFEDLEEIRRLISQ